MIKKVTIEVIDHKQQRLGDFGDWQFDDDSQTLNIRVSALSNWKYNMLVAIHEFVEATLCLERGISEEDVDRFDTSHPDSEEPGNLSDAPYYEEHFAATNIERILSMDLGVLWPDYLKAFAGLPEWEKPA